MSKIDVSIIIPVYKVEETFFLKCLYSVCNQTYKNYEIIIVSDGANDDVISICEKFKLKFKKLRIIKQNNSGVAIARNLGIKMSLGKWIMFVDADDWLEINAIEEYIKHCNLKDDIVISGYFINNNSSEELKMFFDNSICKFNEVQKEHAILELINSSKFDSSAVDHGVPWGKLYKREFLIKNKIRFPKNMVRFQDNIFNLYCFYYSNSVSVFTMPLYHYRIHDNSVTNKKGNYKIEYLNRLVKETCTFCENLFNTKEAKIRINMKIFHLRNLYIVSYLNNTNKIDYDTLKRDVKNNLEIYLREGVSIFKYLSIKHKFIYIMLKFHIYHLIKIYCQ